MKNFKEFIKYVKELSKTSKGRGVLFFGAYLVFFLILIVIARVGGGNTYTGSDYEKGNPYTFNINNIIDNNYQYSYKITVDDVVYEYVGKRYENSELFTLGANSYYSENDNYFVNNGSLWVKSDNPYKFAYFLDITNVNNIINKATYVSKTNYESGKTSYNFLISSNTLIPMIKNIHTDIAEVPNEIVINTDEDGNVNEIKFKLDSYCINTLECTKSLDIELYYDSFGEVEEITSPLN